MSITFTSETPYTLALTAVVHGLEHVEQRIREAEAERLRLLAAAMDIAAEETRRASASAPNDPSSELAYRSIRSEIAAALHQSEYVTERQLNLAHTLAYSYPRTLEAFREGSISERHASVIVEAGTVVGGSDDADAVLRRAGYESAVLPIALGETPGRLRPAARRLAEAHAELSIDERHAEARRRRRVVVVDGEDGMSDLIAHLPAVEAHAIKHRLTAMSRQIASRERRSGLTRDEVRADLLCDLLLGGASAPGRATAADGQERDHKLPDVGGAARGSGVATRDEIQARVQVIVPAAMVLPGHAVPPAGSAAHARPTQYRTMHQVLSEPAAGAAQQVASEPAVGAAMLAGYGPIDAVTARELAANAKHWEMVSVDARGAVLSVARYRPSAEIKRLLAARDQRCRFPGCRVPAARCDIDHTIDAQHGGPTSSDNLAHLCRGHHTLKHNTGWRVTQRPDGVLEWVSPTGRRHRDRPPDLDPSALFSSPSDLSSEPPSRTGAGSAAA